MVKKLTSEEKYIIRESKELYLGERMTWFEKIQGAFPAFRYRNYKLYFFGQFVSLVGVWLQIVAQGWLIFQLSHSAFWVGVVAAVSMIPSLLLSLIGGVIVDRFSKRKILLLTQSLEMLLAFALAAFVFFHWVNIPNLIIFAFLLGIVDALDTPARQAFVVELVEKKDLSSAIALNSGMFNLARVVGPSLAGILIGFLGLSAAFLINGISFLPAFLAIYLIFEQTKLPQEHPRPIDAIREGLVYSFTHTKIRTLLFFATTVTIFGWAYTTILPVITENVFHKGATELGYFYAASGVGALLGTLIISAFAKKVKDYIFILAGTALFCAALIFFSFVTNFYIALGALFFVGLGLVMQFSVINSSIQHAVSDHIRGRVMSIYTVMFLGMSPIGSFQIGLLAEKFGSPLAIRIGIVFVVLYALYVFINRHKIFTTDESKQEKKFTIK